MNLQSGVKAFSAKSSRLQKEWRIVYNSIIYFIGTTDFV